MNLAAMYNLLGQAGYELHLDLASNGLQKYAQLPPVINFSGERESEIQEESTREPPVGGIAAMAAAAALKKQKDATQAPPAGGIAAMAAAAALKKQKDATQAPPAGGIAAMAAAAALKKQKDAFQAPPAGGIAAMAAAAALKKQKDATQAPPAGGIASMAAAAALKKQKDASQAPLAGGIASMAAAAALKKKMSTDRMGPAAGNPSLSIPNLPKDNKEFNHLVGGVGVTEKINTSALDMLSTFCECAETSSSFDHVLSLISKAISRGSFSMPFVHRLLKAAQDEIQSDPNDVSHFVCAHYLAKMSFLEARSEFDKVLSIKTLERSLALVDRAGALDKWINIDTKSALDRMIERPLYILSDLASHHCSLGDWHNASSTCWTLLLRCEHHLPDYHPLVIAAMLDLAGVLMNLGDDQSLRQSTRLLQRSNERISGFLAKLEGEFQDVQVLLKSDKDKGAHDRYRKRAQNVLATLRAFVIRMRRLVGRKMNCVLGNDNNPTVLIYHCHLGDAVSMLANCESRAKVKKFLWSTAAMNYNLSLRGWIKAYGVLHPNVSTITCGLARCLRELGKRQKAIHLLGSVVKMIRNSNKRRGADAPPNEFRPPRFGKKWDSSNLRMYMATERAVAFCQWWMAVCYMEQNASRESVNRAVEILNEISASLRVCLKHSEHIRHDAAALRIKVECEQMMNVVKEELRRLNALSLDMFPSEVQEGTYLYDANNPAHGGAGAGKSKRPVGGVATAFVLADKAVKIKGQNKECEYEGFKPDIAAKRRIAQSYVENVKVAGAEIVRQDVPKPVDRTKRASVVAIYSNATAANQSPENGSPKSPKPTIKVSDKGKLSSLYLSAVLNSDASPEKPGERRSALRLSASEMEAMKGKTAAIKQNNTVPQGPPADGIAAMATAAALMKQKDIAHQGPPAGSIAAMAAAAALKKQTEATQGPPAGGIAAMAAAAALKKQKDAVPQAPPAGSIAAMAAAAALKKQTEATQGPPAGGIAAMAAAAALKKQRDAVPQAPPAGGIAAMAAAVALKKQTEATQEPPVSGIAAMAAAAALKKQKKAAPQAPPAGGIAAMAAAAALKKQKEAAQGPPAGGIAAMAAAAALKKQRDAVPQAPP